jgi:hypothetical protein
MITGSFSKQFFLIIFIILAIFSVSYGQRKGTVICSQTAFKALIDFPEFDYEQPDENLNEYDDRILNSSARRKARNELIKKLQNFSDPLWWTTSVSSLNPCYLRGQPGKLSDDEAEEYKSVEFQPSLFGDTNIRLVLIEDPHYQTNYNGLNGYLLVRKGQNIYVTEVLNGYYSRAANSVQLKTYRKNSQQFITIKTVNISGMKPDYLDYDFVLDQKTNKAIPTKQTKKLIQP